MPDTSCLIINIWWCQANISIYSGVGTPHGKGSYRHLFDQEMELQLSAGHQYVVEEDTMVDELHVYDSCSAPKTDNESKETIKKNRLCTLMIFGLLSSGCYPFWVAMMLYSKWTAPILDRWNNLLRRSESFVLLSAAVFFISLGMFFANSMCSNNPLIKPKFRIQTVLLLKPQSPDISSLRRAISSTY